MKATPLHQSVPLKSGNSHQPSQAQPSHLCPSLPSAFPGRLGAPSGEFRGAVGCVIAPGAGFWLPWTLFSRRRLWTRGPARRDGALLAGDALGAVLLPGLRVLPGPGVAAGHQALSTEAAVAARSAVLPRSSHALVLRPPEGRGGMGEGCWNPRGQRAAPIFSSHHSVASISLMLSPWVAASCHCSPPAPSQSSGGNGDSRQPLWEGLLRA